MKTDLKNDPRYQDHGSRPDLAGEHPLGDTYQLIGMLLFTAAVLIDLVWVGLASRLHSFMNLYIRLPLGLVVVAFGGWLALYGIKIVFSDYTEEPRMITRHMFSIVRHPVYLGAMLVYVGILLITLSPLGLIVFMGVFLLYNWLAQDEEDRMLRLFGKEYQDYQNRVGRWLPRLRQNS